MSEIKRWDIAALGNGFIGMKQTDDGAFVRNADHEEAMSEKCAELIHKNHDLYHDVNRLRDEADRLRAELQNAAKAALDAVALSCEKEREADALRVDAMRYRWLRDQAPWSDSKNPCPYSVQEDGRLRCITAGLDEQIDAAMGASA